MVGIFIHVRFPGGGDREEAARRCIPARTVGLSTARVVQVASIP